MPGRVTCRECDAGEALRAGKGDLDGRVEAGGRRRLAQQRQAVLEAEDPFAGRGEVAADDLQAGCELHAFLPEKGWAAGDRGHPPRRGTVAARHPCDEGPG